MDCPEAIHQLMLDCWQKERGHRPTFSSIVKTLDKLICCPETLKKIANSPVHNPFASNVPDYSAFVSVDQWLASIKMTRYSENFRCSGIDSMDEVAKLSLQQLVDIGVTLVGHQKKIMGSIHAMRAQLSVNMSEGFLVWIFFEKFSSVRKVFEKISSVPVKNLDTDEKNNQVEKTKNQGNPIQYYSLINFFAIIWKFIVNIFFVVTAR